MFQMLRDSDTIGANCHQLQGRRPAGLRLREAEPAARARHRRRLHAGVQPAGALLLRQREEEGRRGEGQGRPHDRHERRDRASAATCSSSSSRRSCARRPSARTPNYAPIHNTSGLILNELGQVNTAVEGVPAAAQLDPHFFEAQMNLAAINLSFRGFDKAEAAYRKALEMHPNDYDAHLGLALALRGQIDDSNYDKQVAAVQAELDACKKIDARARTPTSTRGSSRRSTRRRARAARTRRSPSTSRPSRSSRPSWTRRSGKPEYDGAVKKAKERMQDIDDTDHLPPGGRATPPPPAAAPAAPDAAAPAPAASATPAPAPGAAPAAPLRSGGGACSGRLRDPRASSRGTGTRTIQSSRCQEPRATRNCPTGAAAETPL